jgi:hypothetical protein
MWFKKFNLAVETWLRSLKIEVVDVDIKARYLGAALSISALLKITAVFAVRKAKKLKSVVKVQFTNLIK